jgi:peptidyl-prolyl cis-trans isomerase SurA
MISIRQAFWLLLLIPFLTVSATAQETEEIDTIVALVDSDVILRSELEMAVAGIVERIRQSGGQLPAQDLLEKQVLERLVVRKLQVQRALQTGIRVSDADIDQALMGLAQQNGITLLQMRQVIEQDGEDFGEFRLNIGEELLTDRLQQRVVNGMLPISDTEIEILLASDSFSGGEFHISHIMVALPDGATPAQIKEAADTITDIWERLRGGLDFASAAISYSESQEALEGGEVGWRDLNSIPKTFADAITSLLPGDFTQPIRSPGGMHIIKVNDKRARGQIVISEVSARHIMIRVDELVTAREAMDTIRDLQQQVTDGADFAELAREYSDDPSSANIGGDMGWFPPDAYGPRIQQALVALKDNEVSEPFQTEGGWHLIEKLGTRESDVTDEAIRNVARENLRQRKVDQEIESFMRQLRDEAFVELRLQS